MNLPSRLHEYRLPIGFSPLLFYTVSLILILLTRSIAFTLSSYRRPLLLLLSLDVRLI